MMQQPTLRLALITVAVCTTCACSAAPVRYTVTDLGTLPGCSQCWGLGINNAGQVVGEAWKVSGDSLAVLYKGGKLINLNAAHVPHSGWVLTDAAAINLRGQIVGEGLHHHRRRAYLFQNGTVIDLGVLSGDQGSTATGLSETGEITGYSFSQSQIHSFLYHLGKMTPMDIPGQHDGLMPDAGFPSQILSPDFISAHSYYSNHSGQAVGEGIASSGASSAFVVSRGTKMVDLNKLIDPHSGWYLEGAGGINDKGQIVGRGMHRGKRHAFLLTPLDK